MEDLKGGKVSARSLFAWSAVLVAVALTLGAVDWAAHLFGLGQIPPVGLFGNILAFAGLIVTITAFYVPPSPLPSSSSPPSRLKSMISTLFICILFAMGLTGLVAMVVVVLHVDPLMRPITVAGFIEFAILTAVLDIYVVIYKDLLIPNGIKCK